MFANILATFCKLKEMCFLGGGGGILEGTFYDGNKIRCVYSTSTGTHANFYAGNNNIYTDPSPLQGLESGSYKKLFFFFFFFFEELTHTHTHKKVQISPHNTARFIVYILLSGVAH